MPDIDSVKYCGKYYEKFYNIPEKYIESGIWEKIGSGSTAKVFRIGEQVIRIIDCGNDEDKFRNCLHEKAILEKLRQCGAAVNAEDTGITKKAGGGQAFYFVMPYYTSLENYFSSENLYLDKVLKVVVGICEAVQEVKSRGVLHLDLKPSNIFIDEEENIRLGDFGSALTLEELEKNTSSRGTLRFMAPEVYSEQRCSESSEVYSIGLILYYLLNGLESPFVEGRSSREQRELAVYKRLAGTKLPALWLDTTPIVIELINNTIEKACAFSVEKRAGSLNELWLRLRMICAEVDALPDAVPIPQAPGSSFGGVGGDTQGPLFDAICGSLTEPRDTLDVDPIATSMADTFSRPCGETSEDPGPIWDGRDIDPIATSIPQPSPNDILDIFANRFEPIIAKPDFEGDLKFGKGETESSREDKEAERLPDFDDIFKKMFTECRVCGNRARRSDTFCSFCGSKLVIEKPAVELSRVEFSAVAPKKFVRGEYSMVDIVMYEEDFRYIVDELHQQSDVETQEKKKGIVEVPDAARIRVQLTSPDVEIEDNEEEGVWKGSYLNFSFPVLLPEDYSKPQVKFDAKVFINGVSSVRLSFFARCTAEYEQKPGIERRDIMSAFVSYSSEDRKEVIRIIQGICNARKDMDLFLDVESLRTGEHWEEALYREIDRRDVLYLCWSHNAKESEWVDREWRHSYDRKGLDGIEPFPLELPDVCPPPEDLKDLHWGEKLNYVIEHMERKEEKEDDSDKQQHKKDN